MLTRQVKVEFIICQHEIDGKMNFIIDWEIKRPFFFLNAKSFWESFRWLYHLNFEGWQGDLCDVPICRKGCDPMHGYCKKPGECRCNLGFYGEKCDRCIPLPGCQHGYCNVSFECICKEGWDGLFCTDRKELLSLYTLSWMDWKFNRFQMKITTVSLQFKLIFITFFSKNRQPFVVTTVIQLAVIAKCQTNAAVGWVGPVQRVKNAKFCLAANMDPAQSHWWEFYIFKKSIHFFQ